MPPIQQWSHETSTPIATCPATVRVKNLQATIIGPQDAWGRHDRPQPITVSAAVTFESPFNATSSGDALSLDTLHYGFLAKAILTALEECSNKPDIQTLEDVLDYAWKQLSHMSLKTLTMDGTIAAGEPLVDCKRAFSMQLTATLPKASLTGSGVSLSATTIFHHDMGRNLVPRASRLARIHDVRLSILIGVNPNEREAKQVVIANIDIDGAISDKDLWTVEKVMVDVSGRSSVKRLKPEANIVRP